VLDLVFRPDPAHRDPVYRQLADHLAELISAQRLCSGEPFRVESAGPPALLLSFAALAPDEIRGGVTELAALARTCARKPRLTPARRASRRIR